MEYIFQISPICIVTMMKRIHKDSPQGFYEDIPWHVKFGMKLQREFMCARACVCVSTWTCKTLCRCGDVRVLSYVTLFPWDDNVPRRFCGYRPEMMHSHVRLHPAQRDRAHLGMVGSSSMTVVKRNLTSESRCIVRSREASYWCVPLSYMGWLF